MNTSRESRGLENVWISSGDSTAALQSLLAARLTRLTQLHLLSHHAKDPICEMAQLSDHPLGFNAGSLPPENAAHQLTVWKVKTFVTAPRLFQHTPPASLP